MIGNKSLRLLSNKSLILNSILITFFFNVGYCQIDYDREKKTVKKPTIKVYDSLKNFLWNDFKLYKGQVLFVVPKEKYKQQSGYRYFRSTLDPYGGLSKTDYKPISNCCTKHEALVYRYFKVLDAFTPKERNLFSNYKNDLLVNRHAKILKLEDVKNKEILFYYHVQDNYDFPFLTVGYYEKIKRKFIGKSFYFRSKKSIIKKMNPSLNIDQVNYKSKWFFERLKVDSDCANDYECHITEKLKIELQNEAGDTVQIEIHKALQQKSKFYFMKDSGKIALNDIIWDTEKCNEIIKRFGENVFFQDILSGKVNENDSKELILLKRGTPQTESIITKDGIDYDRWGYEYGDAQIKTYVYFDFLDNELVARY